MRRDRREFCEKRKNTVNIRKDNFEASVHWRGSRAHGRHFGTEAQADDENPTANN
jgi:hypothetical protein